MSASWKRAFDIAGSAAGLIALGPVLVGISIAVRLDSDGAVLFGHERVGRGGRAFRVWKFRTMVEGASKLGPAVTVAGDPRITRTGRWLRDTKLDELPQLFNVLLGDMSLVGPRPEVRKYVELFPEDYDVILQVRPGITDEASILFRREEDVLARAENPEELYVSEVLPKKIALAKQYVADHGLGKDVSIVLRTLLKVVS